MLSSTLHLNWRNWSRLWRGTLHHSGRRPRLRACRSAACFRSPRCAHCLCSLWWQCSHCWNRPFRNCCSHCFCWPHHGNRPFYRCCSIRSCRSQGSYHCSSQGRRCQLFARRFVLSRRSSCFCGCPFGSVVANISLEALLPVLPMNEAPDCLQRQRASWKVDKLKVRPNLTHRDYFSRLRGGNRQRARHRIAYSQVARRSSPSFSRRGGGGGLAGMTGAAFENFCAASVVYTLTIRFVRSCLCGAQVNRCNASRARGFVSSSRNFGAFNELCLASRTRKVPDSPASQVLSALFCLVQAKLLDYFPSLLPCQPT